MLFHTGNMCLLQVQEILHSEINDVHICMEKNGLLKNYYTVWIVKSHEVSKKLLELLHPDRESELCFDCFALGDSMGFVFPYEKERPLFKFYIGESRTKEEREKIWIEIVEEFIKSRIPYSILYLLLKQKRINIQADGRIRFGYGLFLEELKSGIGEKECVHECARLILELMEEVPKKRPAAYKLISKKCEKNRYSGFIELYKDLKISVEKKSRMILITNIKDKIIAKKDTIFKCLLTICFIFVSLALVTGVSQIIFGEIPIFRLFHSTFEKIGTESLLQ